ncbi:hypothetical protein DW322_02635 [Rhodococcus rhodnii]|uniref:Uncharacterized protein n=2 Tax=Rhodococcus rhodnii TaxID=38312 RepID=R7WU57_9NOCA|nr:hypothetical protein [Rhodococcus rhodnii]EOM77704.1 hypothetical protein Rrhod_0945 [Rhodococcus rhodnii LMG 5362]TXG89338.1 hypothetical protein DW322_02635 [Rhodococcus rhodnii]
MADAAERPRSLPVVALHGWPATFEQMTRLADALAGPEYATTVIAPSLPGSGSPGSPPSPGGARSGSHAPSTN